LDEGTPFNCHKAAIERGGEEKREGKRKEWKRRVQPTVVKRTDTHTKRE
jgi:hypothetical protein